MKKAALSLLNREVMRRPSFRLACGRNIGDISVLLPDVLGRADHIALVADRAAAGSPALKKCSVPPCPIGRGASPCRPAAKRRSPP
ncbi:MAG TPA: hypothetical protein PK523_10400 [Elusimicrobiales bacterium]|nr:hypothetical protein [Elusimicrobiales bacterium]